jgi:hypothetical protein
MAGKLELSLERNREQFEVMNRRTEALRKGEKDREDRISDLESTLQLHTEHLQNLQAGEEELRRFTAAQIATHSQETADRMKNLENETKAKIQEVEKASAERITAIQDDTTQQIELLKKSNATSI